MSFLKDARIGTRLAFGFSLALLFCIASIVVGLYQLNRVADATRETMALPLKKERLTADWYRNVFAGIRRTTAIAKSSDDSLATFFKDDVVATNSADIQKAFESLLSSDAERELFKRIGEARNQYLKTRDGSMKEKKAGNAAEALRILEQEYVPAARNYEKVLLELLSMQRAEIDRKAAEIEQAYRHGRDLMIALGVLLVLTCVGSAWLISRGITRPVGRAAELARIVASGDLTADISVESKDETGHLMQSLKDMNDSLARMVGTLANGTHAIVRAAGQIASGNRDLSARSEQQASSLEETASAMEELTSTVQQNAANARQANELAISASAIAKQGGQVVAEVVTTMRDIHSASGKISDIIAVIDGIAFQTNILALNAAVEAARAGEQGRGFAVVAMEVRNLAKRSGEAAKEIKTLINDSVDKVGAGTRLVDQAGLTMREVVESIHRVTGLMGEITTASNEQSAGIEQVSQAIVQMEQATQQNGALVEQSAAAAHAMREQADALAEIVDRYKIRPGENAGSPGVSRLAA